MTDYADFGDARIKHLELIQAVISRLGTNGFLMKGWAVTVAAAFFGFAVQSKSWQLALVAILPTLAFWALDAYFLRCERLFRELYRRVHTMDKTTLPFFMAATSHDFVISAPADSANYWKVFWSATLGYFFTPIMGAAILVMVIVLRSGHS